MKNSSKPDTSRQVKTVIVLKNKKDTLAPAKYIHTFWHETYPS